MARQRLGQHFLGDVGWRRRILDTLPRHAGETWVEIGAGHGEMTELLAGDGRRVIAIETDAQLAERLRERVSGEPADWPGVEVVSADVLHADLLALTGAHGKPTCGKFRVYGNLPYYITSPILHHLFRWADQIASIHIVIQLEVAARIAARPGRREYGYLSAACQFYGKPEIVMRIPPGAFRPPPRVTSALVRMTLPGERAGVGITDEQQFLEFVQLCFGQKRKTLRNNLRAVTSDERIHEALATDGLRADARAEQLSLAQFAGLFKRLK
jgi:16S rRNA (adenine1518-N6/adenine1519-N6)-dimethyltransferase